METIPIEFNNMYKLKQKNTVKNYFEYEWIVNNIFSDNDRRHYAVNIISTFYINSDVYISIYEYLSLVQNMIDNNFIMDKQNIAERANFEKFNNFLRYYNDNHNMRNFYDTKIIKSCYKFIKNKTGINNVTKYNGFYCCEGRNSKILEQQLNFITTNTHSNEKAIVIEIVFSQKSFFAQFAFKDGERLDLDS
jgi:hypothetical protein